MKNIKALNSFSGGLTMAAGEERVVLDAVAEDLVRAKHAVVLNDAGPDPDAPKPSATPKKAETAVSPAPAGSQTAAAPAAAPAGDKPVPPATPTAAAPKPAKK